MRLIHIAAVVAMESLVGNAQAELFDRGGGLIYDDVLNITWLKDANYAKTSGYDTDGKMNWTAANAWAANLSYGGYDDWRLAANTPVGAGWNFAFAKDGSTDVGYNITSSHSELSYMYYVNLGMKGYFSTAGVLQPNFGIFGNGTVGGQTNAGLVDNLQSAEYWSGTTDAPNPVGYAFYFGTAYGDQASGWKAEAAYAWAVRPGDVPAIPEPETYAMMLAGLGLLGLARLRKQSKP